MNPIRRDAIQTRLNKFVTDGDILGAGVGGVVDGESYTFVSGFRDTARTQLFTDDTIIRNASDSKVMGVVAFLKLFDRGLITGYEPLAQYIPAFANTKVIDPFDPVQQVNLDNPFSITSGSNVLRVQQKQHGLSTGDVIGFQNAAVGGIPASELNKIHTVTVTNPNRYTVQLAVAATSSANNQGGNVLFSKLSADVKQTSYEGQIHYYREAALKRPLTIWNILTHTAGYLYRLSALGVPPSGYVDSLDDPVKIKKSLIQGGIFDSLALPVAFPLNVNTALYPDLAAWTNTLASIPLLFQPGEDYSYGPTLSVLGRLIEVIDGRPLEQYFKDEITTPLGMNDTGFFIQDSDPDRDDKLSRIGVVSLPIFPGFFLDANTVIPGIGDYFYSSTQSRNLPFFDAGLYSTLADRNKFYTALLNEGNYGEGESFISPAAVSLIAQNRLNDIPLLFSEPPIKYTRWGLGTSVTTGSDNYTYLGQTSRGILWGGFFGTIYVIDFGNKSMFNVALNDLSPSTDRYRRLLANMHTAAIKKIHINDENGLANPVVSVKLY